MTYTIGEYEYRLEESKERPCPLQYCIQSAVGMRTEA